MAEQINVKYVSHRDIEKKAVDSLKAFEVYDITPVPIEKIIDNALTLNVVPFDNLLKVFDVNSCITGDLASVYVDEHLSDYFPLQYNFALAHELGHLILHDYIYKDRPFSTIDGYKRFIGSFSEAAYAAFETQANSFAGYFLVPGHQLEKHFEREHRQINGEIIKKFRDKSQKFEVICYTMARRLSPIFQVHERPLRIRIEHSKLIHKYFDL